MALFHQWKTCPVCKNEYRFVHSDVCPTCKLRNDNHRRYRRDYPKKVRKISDLDSISGVLISHGGITHSIGEPCEECDRMKKQFEEDLKSGKVERILREVVG